MSDPTSNIPPDNDPDRHFRTDHLKADLKGRSVRGGAVTMVSQISKIILNFGSTAVMARLLTPEDYGLLGMVVIITGFIDLFKDLGLSTATIQKSEITHKQVSTLLWINVAIGFGITVLTIAIAPLVAWFYNEPRLTPIAMVLAIGFIFGSLTVQHQALLRRQMRFKALSAIDLTSMFVSVIVGIASALMLPDKNQYWALVFARLSMTICNTIGVWILSGWRPGLPDRNSGIGDMLAFGSHITGFSMLNYFSRNTDNLLIGWYWGPQELGLYAKAYQLLLLPFQQITVPISNVALPALSRLQNEPERYRSYYQKGVLMLVILGMPLVVLMFVSADKVILTLLGDQWTDAIAIFRLLAPATFVATFNAAAGWVYTSLRKADRQLRWGIFTAVVDLIAFTIGVRWGAIGVATAYSISRILTRYPAIHYCYKATFLNVTDLDAVIWKPALASVLAGAALFGVDYLILFTQNPAIGLAIDFIIYTLFYILAWSILPNGWQTLRGIVQLIKTLRSKPKEAGNAN
ncbi:lipopolysaccharide biosynthesis protein [Argonema antarcticum]|uniref:lipopolysaccharide biosynthesis protein n=1 Tax=Argonema antarcticum TaxID=2942763 RepID=UPI002012D8D7|nr:lipopolysaccharide biosynthesis protein [Argonema antarcticum]MCL1469346.1 lipopolysaccharide biosynthesis protein [Argonema antarcticum A004/B2]